LRNASLPPSGLVSWWPLDETSGIIAEDINSSNDGTHLNAPTPEPGFVNGSLAFDGIDDYVNISDYQDFELSEQFSVEFWTYVDSIPVAYYPVFSVNDVSINGGGYSVVLLRSGSTYYMRFELEYNATSRYPGGFLQTITDPRGEWRHYAYVFDTNNGAYMYENGILIASDETSNVVGKTFDFHNHFTPRIGNHAAGAVHYFVNGSIDELAVYDRALNSTEVESIYDAGSDGKCKLTSQSEAVPEIGSNKLIQYIIILGLIILGASLVLKKK